MLRLKNLICYVLLGTVYSQIVAGDEIDKGSHLLICEQEPIELGIVLDVSSSIREEDFKKGKRFLQDFLEQFGVGNGRNGVRVSIITFDRFIYPQDGFNLTTYTNKADVLDAVSRIPHRKGKYTATGKGITYMHKHQLRPNVVRPHARKVGLVITDGNSQQWRLTESAAKDARSDGIIMFALGVGNVKDEELERIAGDEERVTKVENYSSLSSVKGLLARKTCIRKEKPTTPPPKAQKCGEDDPTDINFVFSPADLGLDATAWTTSFISQIMESEKMSEGFQYGAVTGSCPEDAGFTLNRYDDVDDIREHLLIYDRYRLTSLAKKVMNEGFSAKNGARKYARKIVVLVVNGNKGAKKGQLRAKVQALKRFGAEVFIANPEGAKIAVKGAISLQGEMSRQQSADFINRLCPE